MYDDVIEKKSFKTWGGHFRNMEKYSNRILLRLSHSQACP